MRIAIGSDHRGIKPKEFVKKVLADGAEKARGIADKKIAEVKKKVGLI